MPRGGEQDLKTTDARFMGNALPCDGIRRTVLLAS
jgi:hypothetical protein